MIITDKFILLNLPKTGSTFARTVVKKLHGYEESLPSNRHARKLYLFFQRRILASGLLGFRELQVINYLPLARKFGLIPWFNRDPHKPWSHLPDKYKNRPVVMVVRDPMDMVISGYHYRFIQKNLTQVGGVPIKTVYPDFPNLNFESYLDLLDRIATNKLQWQNIQPQTHIGYLSIQFINLVFKSPQDAFKRMSDSYLKNREFLPEMPSRLHLLRNETLNEDLAKFLTDVGYSAAETAFIKDYPRLNESEYHDGRSKAREEYFSDRLEERFRTHEHVLYSVLNHLGARY